MPLTVADFVHRWKINSQSERASAQSHFNDLCQLLGEKTPPEADPVGERYAFEKQVSKTRGGTGFADVWLRDHFAWEYKCKGKHKTLEKAYQQLNDYREDLGNPPLLVVSDFERLEVHTNFTATRKRVYAFTLDDLNRNHVTASCPLPPLEVLRALFGDYNVLRPEYTDARVTQEVAKRFSRLAESLELENRILILLNPFRNSLGTTGATHLNPLLTGSLGACNVRECSRKPRRQTGPPWSGRIVV